jgi:membrane protein DedA with SNARE-associated domain
VAGDTLTEMLAWVIRHGYVFMFVAMVLEGPLATIASAFGAALGYFHIYWVVALSFLGNLLPDCLYYFLGYWGGRPFLERYGRPLGITAARLDRWSPLAGRHVGQWMLLVKEVPLIGPTGIAVMGVLRVPVRRYLWWDVAINATTALLLAALGFYAGQGYTQLLRYTQYHAYVLMGGAALLLLLSYLYRRVVSRFWSRAERRVAAEPKPPTLGSA